MKQLEPSVTNLISHSLDQAHSANIICFNIQSHCMSTDYAVSTRKFQVTLEFVRLFSVSHAHQLAHILGVNWSADTSKSYKKIEPSLLLNRFLAHLYFCKMSFPLYLPINLRKVVTIRQVQISTQVATKPIFQCGQRSSTKFVLCMKFKRY